MVKSLKIFWSCNVDQCVQLEPNVINIDADLVKEILKMVWSIYPDLDHLSEKGYNENLSTILLYIFELCVWTNKQMDGQYPLPALL